MVRVVFMGTPAFSVPVLEQLIASCEVVGVVTQPDRPAGRGKKLTPPPVKEAAVAANIPVYQPQSLRKEESGAPIKAWAPDLIVVAAYGQILRPYLLAMPRYGCLNIHASLLPRWRGAAPIQHAILAGDKESGVALMQMDKGLDTGPVYQMESFPLAEDETAATLHDKLSALGASMLERHLDAIIAGELLPVPQPEEGATYASMISKEDGRFDWQQPAVQLERRLRAMSPWPGAFTFWQGERLKILQATLFMDPLPAGEAGEILQIGKEVVVRCGAGALRLLQIQLAGKRAVDAQSFIQGRPEWVGTLLGD